MLRVHVVQQSPDIPIRCRDLVANKIIFFRAKINVITNTSRICLAWRVIVKRWYTVFCLLCHWYSELILWVRASAICVYLLLVHVIVFLIDWYATFCPVRLAGQSLVVLCGLPLVCECFESHTWIKHINWFMRWSYLIQHCLQPWLYGVILTNIQLICHVIAALCCICSYMRTCLLNRHIIHVLFVLVIRFKFS